MNGIKIFKILQIKYIFFGLVLGIYSCNVTVDPIPKAEEEIATLVGIETANKGSNAKFYYYVNGRKYYTYMSRSGNRRLDVLGETYLMHYEKGNPTTNCSELTYYPDRPEWRHFRIRYL